jgi:2'-5' RNA ligase
LVDHGLVDHGLVDHGLLDHGLLDHGLLSNGYDPPMSMRMFVAAVPPAQAVADLEEFVGPRRQQDGPLRWTTPEQWHVTLAFLAAVTDRHYDDLVERLSTAAARRPTLTLQLAGAGTFPNPARAKALWLGVSGDTEPLGKLAAGARAAAARSGIEVDGAAFRAHLTLARLNRPVDVTKWLRVFDGYCGPAWHVGEIALIESHLGEGPRGKPRYEVRELLALADKSDEGVVALL